MTGQQVSKILIRTPNWLGDLMMSTAFIKAVLKYFPDATVDLIVRSGFESLPLPHRGSLLPFDKKKESPFAFGKRLKSGGYDRIYVLPPSFSSALMARASGIPQRFGYKGSLRGFLLNPALSYRKSHRSQHLIDEYLQLLDFQTEEEDRIPGLELSDQWIAETLKERFVDFPTETICLAPGAMYGPAKQWPEENFHKLAIKLAQSGKRVVLAGTKNDYEMAERVCAQVPDAVNLAGKTNLLELIAILASSDLLVSNDSGAMHIMAALGKPQIAIFGSTSTTWTGPINNKARVLKKEMDCSPCYRRKCPYGHYQCLYGTSETMVLDTINRLLPPL